MNEELIVNVLGGTGDAGGALAFRLAVAGMPVIVSSRDLSKAQRKIDQMVSSLDSPTHVKLVPGDYSFSKDFNVAVLATPYEGLFDLLKATKNELKGKVVISMVNNLYRVGKEIRSQLNPCGSVAQEIRDYLGASDVSVAFNHLPAKGLTRMDNPIRADVFFASSSDNAKVVTEKIISSIEGLKPVYCGSLALAGPIEAFTACIITNNLVNKREAFIKLNSVDGNIQ